MLKNILRKFRKNIKWRGRWLKLKIKILKILEKNRVVIIKLRLQKLTKK